MIGGSGSRESLEVEALLTDRYLDALLALRDRPAGGARPTVETGAQRVPRATDGSLATNPHLATDGPLATHGTRATDAPPDAATRRAIDRLSRDLVRVHPSFRFEERLAARLAAVAAGRPWSQAPDGDVVVAFPAPTRRPRRGDRRRARAAATLPAAVVAPLPIAQSAARARPVLLGGAVASALSLAGAAFVAWRRARPVAPGDPWTRAVRAAHPARGRSPFSVGAAIAARPGTRRRGR